MTTGSIIIHRDGTETTVTFANTDTLTTEQVNAALAEAGVGEAVRCLTPAEQEQYRRASEARARQGRLDLIEELRLEEASDIDDTMHLFGIVGRLEELSLDDLLTLKHSLEPDSY